VALIFCFFLIKQKESKRKKKLKIFLSLHHHSLKTMALTRNHFERNSSWNAPYTFSGKEKDAETGYGYFGARYYDSGLSIWLSVDPMSDKYPSMSPYNYCANNPVILVDPDGRDIMIIGDPPKMISNLRQAINHYYFGGGKSVEINPIILFTLFATDDFKKHHENILNGTTKSDDGDFPVDMTYEKDGFFIGNTNVYYKVVHDLKTGLSSVTYSIFENDGFWDVNIPGEYSNKLVPSWGIKDPYALPDGAGPNLELGGDPYPFIPIVVTIDFETPNSEKK